MFNWLESFWRNFSIHRGQRILKTGPFQTREKYGGLSSSCCKKNRIKLYTTQINYVHFALHYLQHYNLIKRAEIYTSNSDS
jgi:hypothetical protein